MISVIQFRTDQSGWHELKCIYESAGLSYDGLFQVNAASKHISTKDLLEISEESDAVIMGGLGESGYEETRPAKREWLESLIAKVKPFIQNLIAKDKPTLGICFGHQLIADVTGVKVISSSEYAENGLVDMRLTDEGKNDELFKEFPSEFQAIVSHKSSITELPKGAVHLLHSENALYTDFV